MAAVQKKPKRYYWWRLRKNFFTQITIKKLRRSENGDKKALIYLQMILMTIDNDGYIQFEGVEDDIGDEIAIALDEEPEIVHETIKQLIDMRLIEMVEEDYFLPEAKGGIDSEADSTERSRRCRANKKALQCNTNATDSNADATQCNTNATNGNTNATQSREEKSRKEEIREEIEKEKEKELEFNHVPDNKTSEYLAMFKDNIGHDRPPMYTDFDNICKMFNEICKSFKPITDIETYTENHSKVFTDCAIKGYTEEDYRIAFNKVENNDYLKGQVGGKTEPSELSWMLERLDKIIGDGYRKY